MRKPTSFLALFVLWITVSCAPKVYFNHFESQSKIIKVSPQHDTAMVFLLSPYKLGVDTMMSNIIGYTDVPLTKAAPESLLGNFMCETMLKAAQKINPQTVASVMNYGGIRLDFIAPGPITMSQIYELMPFDNVLTIMEIPGSVIRVFCNKMAARKGWPIAGMRYVIKDKKATEILVNNEPLNDQIIYTIAVNDYLANGGDDCDILRPLKRSNTGIFIREILIEELKNLHRQGQTLHPQLTNRITYAQ